MVRRKREIPPGAISPPAEGEKQVTTASAGGGRDAEGHAAACRRGADFQQRVHRVYVRFRCRISFALAKGLGLQVSIYALERRLPGGLKQFVQRHRAAIPLPVLHWTNLETLPAVAQARRCPRAGGTVRH